jgi:Tyosinase C-terminal domain
MSSLFHGFQRFTITKPMAKPTIHENLVRLPVHSPPPSNPHPPATPAPAPHSEDYVVTPDTYQDWTANATLEKYSLGGSGQVCFFLGPASEIPTNPKDWFTSHLLVGKFGIFASNPTITGCDNCKTQEALHTRVGGTVHLTKALIRHRVPLVGNAPVEYLKENLHWRASTVKGVEVPIADIPSLKVVVQSAGYRLPPAGGIGARPVKLPSARHAPITSGKPGGVDHGDDFNQ